MVELLEMVTSWRSLALALVVFGFAPGFCLRLVVLIYPRHDPRRAELIAELYAMPRIKRPLWVAEQLETALFDGLPHRVSARRHRRRVVRRPIGVLDRALIRAVIRALDRGHGLVPVPTRDLAPEINLARTLAREFDLDRNLDRELQLARTGDPQRARQLARELAPSRALELALVRALECGPIQTVGGEGGTTHLIPEELDPELAHELAVERDLELAFERTLAFARILFVVGILHQIRALARRIHVSGKRWRKP